jgi:hypothetical protein
VNTTVESDRKIAEDWEDFLQNLIVDELMMIKVGWRWWWRLWWFWWKCCGGFDGGFVVVRGGWEVKIDEDGGGLWWWKEVDEFVMVEEKFVMEVWVVVVVRVEFVTAVRVVEKKKNSVREKREK